MRPPWFSLVQAALVPWRGQGVVVAVSGGGDSVALLRALVELRAEGEFRLTVATFDHSTRQGASTADAAFVAGLAARLDLPCDLGRWQSHRAGHFEADARRARYAWLGEIAQQRQAAAVAVGHTSDDQAETILHRIVRGTGLTGLAGMAPRRQLAPGVALIRPILAATRHDLRAYLTTIGQDWREDASNGDPTRTRARIRHDLLPRLAGDYNPNVVAALIHLGRTAAEAARHAHRQAARRLARLTVSRDEAAIVLDRSGLARLDQGGRLDLIRLAWQRQGWPAGRMTHDRWSRLAACAGHTEPGRVALIAGIEALINGEYWTLRRRPTEPFISIAPQRLTIPGAVLWFGGRVSATRDAMNPMDEWVDLDAVNGPLVVRPPRPGDRFDPLGMAGHSQPLADFCRARRIPRADRAQIPLVTDNAGIIWVAGHRIAHRVRRTEATTRLLGLRYEAGIFPA